VAETAPFVAVSAAVHPRQWVGEEDQEDDDTEHGEWVLRGKEPLTVRRTLEHLPSVMHGWVLDSTRRAIGGLRDLAHEKPAFKVALDKLRGELADVEPGTSTSDGAVEAIQEPMRRRPTAPSSATVATRRELARNSPESRPESLTGFQATNSRHASQERGSCKCARSAEARSAPERIRTSDLRFRRTRLNRRAARGSGPAA
jgi:hypothetical protein